MNPNGTTPIITPTARSNLARRGLYRHCPASDRDIIAFPVAIQDFAVKFADMQDRRHTADYAPDADFRRSDVVRDIARIESIIADFNALNISDRRAFAVHVLFNHNR